MSFIANAISNFLSNTGSDRSFIERLNPPATIPVSSGNWVVDPSTHQDVAITVKGSLAHGRVRYAGLDSIPADGPAKVHAKIETNVHVSHLDLAPLVTIEVQGTGADGKSEKVAANHAGQWNLTITTPTAEQVPKSVGSKNAGIDVDVLVTMVPGAPADTDGAHADTGSADAFNSVKVETVNLSHSWLAHEAATAANDSAVAVPSAHPPKPATRSLDVTTTNGEIALSPPRPWSIGRRLSVTSMNGAISVAGPVHVPSHVANGSPTHVDLTTTNGSVTSHVVGANAVESRSMNGRVSSWTERVDLVKAESVNGSVAVHANEVPAGASVSGSSVNGRVAVLAALAQAVDQVRLSASSTVGSVLAEVRAAGWPAASEKPASSFVGKKVVLDLKSLREKRAAVEAQKVMVDATTVNGSVKVAIVDASEVLKI